MRQRLHIARGLLHDPDVLFLDEPSIGIDPVGARELRATIASLSDVGKTVLLTTHYMFEADELCDRIAVIREGEIVAEGTPEHLKRLVSVGSVVEIETYGVADAAVAELGAIAGVQSVAVEERGQMQVLILHCDDRRRGDPGRARPAGRRAGRSGRHPRADARGRLRRAGEPTVKAGAAPAARLLPAPAQGDLDVVVRRRARGLLPADVRHGDAAGLPGEGRPGGHAVRRARARRSWACGPARASSRRRC